MPSKREESHSTWETASSKPPRTAAPAVLDAIRALEAAADAGVQPRPPDGAAAGRREIDGPPAGALRRCACRFTTRSASATPRTTTICSTPARSVSRWLGQPGAARRRRRSHRGNRTGGRRRLPPRASRQPRLSAAQMGRRRLLLGTPARRRAGQPGRSRPHHDRRRRARHREILAGGPALRAADSAGLLPLHHRSRRRLPVARSAARRHHARRRRPAAARPAKLRGRCAIPTSASSSISRSSRIRKAASTFSTLLPLLASLRRRTGLPHKILLDEAHYYLGGPRRPVADRPGAGGLYPGDLPVSGLCPVDPQATDTVVMVTRETDPHEAETLRAMCRRAPAARFDGRLSGAQPERSGAAAGRRGIARPTRRFQSAPRLDVPCPASPKYLDMPVTDSQAFVFTATAGRARAPIA